MDYDSQVLIVMRGLPWCGKSHTAATLKGDTGVILSTDEYFYSVLKPDAPNEYSFDRRFLHDAHRWNHVRAQSAIERSVSPIIIDNTNTTVSEYCDYVAHAHHNNYKIEFCEPSSERWQVIRELLWNKFENEEKLNEWAARLAEGSKQTHNVPQAVIQRMMWRWENTASVEAALEFWERQKS